MSIDIVRGELERLFSLEEMLALSTDLLGFDPNEVGGAASKASFARALTDRCTETQSLDALIDALIASRPDADARLRDASAASLVRDELKPGDTFGAFTITRKLGEGPRGTVYAAKKDDLDRTLKILRSDAARDPGAARRFMTYARLVGRVQHEGLPREVESGIIDGRGFVAYAHVEGQSVAARIARTGPLHINEGKAILKGVLDALAALHERRLAHGALKLENVILTRAADGTQHVVLVDAGGDRLGGSPAPNGRAAAPWGSVGIVKGASPEQLRGKLADATSDLYAFGALLFELLTGKPPFVAETPVDVAIAHLTQTPGVPSSIAPRGWVAREIDELTSKLLEKTPSARPKSVAVVIETLEAFTKTGKDTKKTVSEQELNDKVDAVLGNPEDEVAALLLESLVDRGAEPSKVAEAFVLAADQVEAGEDDAAKAKATSAKKDLLFRAARIYEGAKILDRAETTHVQILALDPNDAIAFAGLEEVRRALGKHEDLVEMLLERGEKSPSHTERAQALNKIGHLYVKELDDKGQAIFAFAQALAQDTMNDEYATDLERAAGTDTKQWAEALQILSQVTTHPRMPAEPKIALFGRLGHWYSEKIARPDLGLPCFQAVLSVDPANDDALAGLALLYRRAQQWLELVQVLSTQADRAPTPTLARNIRSEAAEILEKHLGDAPRARELFEQIFEEDPGHTKAADALDRIYQRLEDWVGYARVLRRRADALRGPKRLEALCKLAELHEDQLNDLPEATRIYDLVLETDRQNLTALKGLDRIYNRTGRYNELLENLERQIAIAATPRQKINLYERIAGIHEEEFLDHAHAAQALEHILEIDGAHEGALSSLIRHYRALDRWEQVISLYERHLRIITDNARRIDMLLTLGRVLVDHVGSPERARQAFEKVLEIEPQHAGALESLASVRAATGDAMAALSAVESLAAKATTPEGRADLWIRAAKILDERGDRDGAIERYKAALDAQPDNPVATAGLRSAYLSRGDATSAVELIAKSIERAEGNLAKARLYGEMAQLIRERLADEQRARDAAKKAVDLDPTNMLGLLILGDFAFEDGHFIEASKHYESLANRVDALSKEDGTRLLVRYVDALSKAGSTEKAIGTVKTLLALAPDDPEAIARAAKVSLDAGKNEAAAELYADVSKRFAERLSTAVRAEVMLNLGLARLRAGKPDDAILPLMEAADLDPESAAPINALCDVHVAKKDWEEVVRIKNRRLDVVSGDERSALLLEIGEILATHIGDRTRASKSFVAALDERPDDRKILTKLMQLYSEEKDWSKLIDVVLKLAQKVDDKRQKAKYVHTAAIVCARQLGELDKAAAYYDEVLDLDPTLDRALAEAVEIHGEMGDHEGVERLLKLQLEQASDKTDTGRMLETFEALGILYKDKLGWMSEAIDAYEAAQTLDPDNAERNELLAKLYASDPAQYLDKAVAAQTPILRRDPYRTEPYKLLRKLYTEAKRADAAWCLCQGLYLLNAAEPDEERFFRRMRADNAAAAVDRLTDEDWAAGVMHEDADPLLTAIFALIEPAVLKKNGQALESLGYQMAYALDLALHPYPMSQTLLYASGVLGMEPPLTFQNPNDPGGVSFLHAHTPAIVLGQAALVSEVPTQAGAFIAARHLTYYRPGLYLRHLVPTGTGLRAWLFAAIRMIVPAFPVSAELDGAVKENQTLLEATIVGPTRDHLASAVTKLLQAGAIDLKKWIAAVDLSADRAGFILANDLELAQEMIKAADESASAAAQRERLKELLLYAASEPYFAVRRRLGINIDS